MLTNAVRAVSKEPPDSTLATKSTKCWGRRPSTPPEEPAGKERRAFWTSDSSTNKTGVTWGLGTGLLSTYFVGCLDCSLRKDSTEKSAGVSSEQRILTAARMLPSSNLAATASAKLELDFRGFEPDNSSRPNS